MNLVDVLDFYEFEDEYLRTRLIVFTKSITNLKHYNFKKFKEYWSWVNINDDVLWDYL